MIGARRAEHARRDWDRRSRSGRSQPAAKKRQGREIEATCGEDCAKPRCKVAPCSPRRNSRQIRCGRLERNRFRLKRLRLFERDLDRNRNPWSVAPRGRLSPSCSDGRGPIALLDQQAMRIERLVGGCGPFRARRRAPLSALVHGQFQCLDEGFDLVARGKMRSSGA